MRNICAYESTVACVSRSDYSARSRQASACLVSPPIRSVVGATTNPPSPSQPLTPPATISTMQSFSTTSTVGGVQGQVFQDVYMCGADGEHAFVERLSYGTMY